MSSTELAVRIVEILFPLFAITALGFAAGKRMRPDLSHANRLAMDVFTPSLTFAALAGHEFHLLSYLPLLAACFLYLILAALSGLALAKLGNWQVRTVLPPMTFNNSANLGLPLAVFAFGEQALAPAVVLFILTSLAHFSFGAWLLDRNIRLRALWRVPTVFAALLGVLVSMLEIPVWTPLMTAIKMLGDVAIPMMLFALGVRIAQSKIDALRLGLIVAVARPVSGMFIAWALARLLRLPPEQAALILVYGSLPPAVLNFMFAERYRQEPEKVASIVLVGNMTALFSLPVALALVL